MADIVEFFSLLSNPEALIMYGGLLLVFLVVFAENGVVFGALLPGESMVFLSGVCCKIGALPYSLFTVTATCFAAAFLGHQFGYLSGYKWGRAIVRKDDSIFFKRKHIALARTYFRKYGWKTIFIGRYIPVVRTFAPILAGTIQMDSRKFAFYNLISTSLWAIPFVLLGYSAGVVVPQPGKYMPLVFIGLLLCIVLPLLKPLLGRASTPKIKDHDRPGNASASASEKAHQGTRRGAA